MSNIYHYPSKNPLFKLKKRMLSQGLNSNTIKTYFYHINNLLKNTKKSPRNISSNDIINYLDQLVKEGKSRSTLNIAHSALKLYFENILRRNFFAPHGKIERAKIKKEIPKIPTNKEVSKILRLSKKNTYQLIFQLLYTTGIKISEVLLLKKENIDLINKQIKIKNDTLDIPSEAFNKIKFYIVDLKNNNFLFTNTHKKPLSSRSVQKYFSQIIKTAKLNKSFTPNLLRHLFVYNLIQQGKTAEEIQKRLRHKFSDTTRIYLKTFSQKNKLNKKIQNIFYKTINKHHF